MSTKEKKQDSVERRWDRWDFCWKVNAGTDAKGNKIWKATKNENKERSDKDFIERWCEFHVAGKELHEFCRGWDWGKRKAMERRRRLNTKFGRDVLPELPNPRKPPSPPTTDELLHLALSILYPKADEKKDKSGSAAK